MTDKLQMKNNNLQTRYILSEGIRLLLILILGVIAGYWIGVMVLRIPYSRILVSKNSNILLDDNNAPSQDTPLEKPKDSSLAEQMHNKVRILCWIMTNPSNHETKATHVKRTWGKRCNKLIFMSLAKDEEAYKYIYEHHINDADWFLKANDETYMIVENLRYMLYPYDPETPVYFGCKFKPHIKQGYMSGGAGYVLSREAVRRLVIEGFPNPKLCYSDNTSDEDVEIGKCLAKLNVSTVNENDNSCPFLSVNLFKRSLYKKQKYKSSFWHHIYKSIEKSECCSDNEKPNQLYFLEYLINHLRPYGTSNIPALPKNFGYYDLTK